MCLDVVSNPENGFTHCHLCVKSFGTNCIYYNGCCLEQREELQKMMFDNQTKIQKVRNTSQRHQKSNATTQMKS